jgi:hypothetical protein
VALKFAFKWNWDYQKDAIQLFDNKPFEYTAARNLLKAAVADAIKGCGLKLEIDTGVARVVKGPHKTPGGDTRFHMSVHCVNMRVIYHVYMSKNGNYSGMNQEPVSGMNPKTGHVMDDRSAPTVPDCASL